MYSYKPLFLTTILLLFDASANGAVYTYNYAGMPFGENSDFIVTGQLSFDAPSNHDVNIELDYRKYPDFGLPDRLTITRAISQLGFVNNIKASFTDGKNSFLFDGENYSSTESFLGPARGLRLDFSTSFNGQPDSWFIQNQYVIPGGSVPLITSKREQIHFSIGESTRIPGASSIGNLIQTPSYSIDTYNPWSLNSVKRVIADIELPRIQIPVPVVKDVQLVGVFDKLAVTAVLNQPGEGFLIDASIRPATLVGSLINPSNGKILLNGHSTAEASLKVTDSLDPIAFWSTPGFEIYLEDQFAGNTGPISYAVALDRMGLDRNTPIEQIVRTAEAFIHTDLSDTLFGNQAPLLQFVDPGDTELLVIDPVGRRSGSKNGIDFDEIPGFYYDPDVPMLGIAHPQMGLYKVEVTALSDGAFTLESLFSKGSREFGRNSYAGFLRAGESISFLKAVITVPEPTTNISLLLLSVLAVFTCSMKRDIRAHP